MASSANRDRGIHRRAANSGTRVARSFLAIATIFVAAETALAHGGPLDRPVDWADWNLDPVILLVLLLLGWVYLRGLLRMWRRAGVGRVISVPRVWCFVAGLLLLLAALVSPLDPLSDQLSSAHMVQHMILMTASAPLMMAGAPSLVLLWGLSPEWRRTLAYWWSRWRSLRTAAYLLWQPLLVGAIYALAMWVWHVPSLYEAALLDPYVHDIQHVKFFVAACLFWRVLLDPISRHRLHAPAAVVLLFATALHATILGVLMTLAPTPWYLAYEGRTSLWGLTPLEDQQLAGLIMWMPACLAYLVGAVVVLAATLSDPQTTARPQKLGRRRPIPDSVIDPLGHLILSRSVG